MVHVSDMEYQRDVARAVISSIVDLRPDDDGMTGTIDLLDATQGACFAIAVMAHKSGNFETVELRERWAQTCGNEVLTVMNALAHTAETGQDIGWDLETIGEPN